MEMTNNDVPRGVRDCSWRGDLIRLPSSSRTFLLASASTLSHFCFLSLVSLFPFNSSLYDPDFSLFPTGKVLAPLFSHLFSLTRFASSYSWLFYPSSISAHPPVLPRGAVPPLLPSPLRAPQPCPAHLHPSSTDSRPDPHQPSWYLKCKPNFIWNGTRQQLESRRETRGLRREGGVRGINAKRRPIN